MFDGNCRNLEKEKNKIKKNLFFEQNNKHIVSIIKFKKPMNISRLIFV